MESIDVYKQSYNTLSKLSKSNLTNTVTIDYSKLDERTASAIRLALSRVVGQRRREVWRVIEGANQDNPNL